MHCVGIIVTELIDDLSNPFVFFARSRFADDSLKPVRGSACAVSDCPVTDASILKSTLLPLIIELVIEETLDSLIHVQRFTRSIPSLGLNECHVGGGDNSQC